ncbi:thioredoxin [Bacillus aerolatus]|uniref:Thioredoxin n=1 Tax=Bacillus aerolatus TaxID=2653354 RepID=A0A6I1FKY7_9BACI|nr:thioredoxin [Bacillus aerolatus]KAB7706701.1 thioredoxin [Bacillus aerolatus]
MSNVVTVNEANFGEVTAANEVAVIKFGAPWCGPCKMIAPVLDNLSESMDNVVFGDVDIDESSDLAQQFNIMSVPTILIFKNGSVAKQSMGFSPEEKLKNLISKYL